MSASYKLNLYGKIIELNLNLLYYTCLTSYAHMHINVICASKGTSASYTYVCHVAKHKL